MLGCIPRTPSVTAVLGLENCSGSLEKPCPLPKPVLILGCDKSSRFLCATSDDFLNWKVQNISPKLTSYLSK